MKTLATVGTIQEAQSLSVMLASIGIEAFIPNENTASMLPNIVNPGGVKVQVKEEDLEKALEKMAADAEAEAEAE
jgi:hypothetical protein